MVARVSQRRTIKLPVKRPVEAKTQAAKPKVVAKAVEKNIRGKRALALAMMVNPGMKTNQDLINHAYNNNGGNAAKAKSFLQQRYGTNLNKLAQNRSGSLRDRLQKGLSTQSAQTAGGQAAGAAGQAASGQAASGQVAGGKDVGAVSTASSKEVAVLSRQLRQISGRRSLTAAKANKIAQYLAPAMKKAGITTPKRKAAFLAQLAHESGGFTATVERGSAQRFNRKYGPHTRVGRKLGNTQAGDGARFRGRGLTQLTGRWNYKAAGRAIGVDLIKNPAAAATPENSAKIATWFWGARKLNGLADRGAFRQITKKINGGYNGYADRVQYWAKAKRALASSNAAYA